MGYAEYAGLPAALNKSEFAVFMSALRAAIEAHEEQTKDGDNIGTLVHRIQFIGKTCFLRQLEKLEQPSMVRMQDISDAFDRAFDLFISSARQDAKIRNLLSAIDDSATMMPIQTEYGEYKQAWIKDTYEKCLITP
ncbi:MAG: hypothetical protein SFX19_03990 [Alphaproteobacteria bacterium]|nr:hypothetical protein [Alphaproteobacteria bacterium]